VAGGPGGNACQAISPLSYFPETPHVPNGPNPRSARLPDPWQPELRLLGCTVAQRVGVERIARGGWGRARTSTGAGTSRS
jgi:hypothetical protein